MRKAIAVMIVVLFISLTGCNQTENNTSAATKSTTEGGTSVQPTSEISTSIATTTVAPATTLREYTAEELSEMTVPKIIDIMGGEFRFDQSKGVIWYSDGGFYIYNDESSPDLFFTLTKRRKTIKILRIRKAKIRLMCKSAKI